MPDYTVLPHNFLDKVNALISPEKREAVLQSFCHPRKPALRINTIFSGDEEIIEELNKTNIAYKKIPWAPHTYIVETNSRHLTSLHSYTEGKFYIQGLSSMIPALILDPKPGERVLDIAAAPGSKTTQMGVMMQNKGEIVANDVSRQRLFKLKANLTQQGVTNTKITNIPGEKIWKKFPEYFDKTLVDAPCTMEGRFDCHDSKSYKDWSPRKVKELAHRQQFLLRSAITSTKPGGTIVYSTCTLSPEENEEVINWVLEKEGPALSLEEISLPGLPFAQGLTQWKDKKLLSCLSQTARIWPSDTMEGFFIARLKKHKTTLRPELFMKGQR